MDDTRNVIDYYKYWKTEAIKADLDARRLPFAVLCCNIQGDFSLSSIIRNCNAFLAEKVFIYGRKRWDRRGAVGTHHYERIVHLSTEKDLECLSEYAWVGVDNIDEATPIEDFCWPDKPLLCFGEEGSGLTKEILDKCSHIVYIPQRGSVRSLNVAVAAGIAIHDLVVKIDRKLIIDAKPKGPNSPR